MVKAFDLLHLARIACMYMDGPILMIPLICFHNGDLLTSIVTYLEGGKVASHLYTITTTQLGSRAS